MTVLKILHYPHKSLKTVASEVTVFDDALHQMIKDLYETMYAGDGVGLAAPQVGISARIFVIDAGRGQKQPRCFINPVIIEREGEVELEEACLSLPGIYAKVLRAQRIVVNYQDEQGVSHSLDTDGLTAHCIQHELDHLNGTVFIDRLSKLKQMLLMKKYGKHQRLAS